MSEHDIGATGLLGSTVVATGNHISTKMDGEEIILHLDSNRYYGLNGVGTLIWKLVQDERTVAEIRAELMDEYDVEPERCGEHLDTFLTELAEQGLIEIIDETDS